MAHYAPWRERSSSWPAMRRGSTRVAIPLTRSLSEWIEWAVDENHAVGGGHQEPVPRAPVRGRVGPQRVRGWRGDGQTACGVALLQGVRRGVVLHRQVSDNAGAAQCDRFHDRD